MMRYDTNIEKLLWASMEDYCGLWELVWEINTLHPNNSPRESQHITLHCILDLLSRDLVQLYHCQEPYGRMTMIRRDNYFRYLQDHKVWEPPPPKAHSVRVSATEAGEKYYHAMMNIKRSH